MKKVIYTLIFLLSSILVASCGGGDDGDTPQNIVPSNSNGVLFATVHSDTNNEDGFLLGCIYNNEIRIFTFTPTNGLITSIGTIDTNEPNFTATTIDYMHVFWAGGFEVGTTAMSGIYVPGGAITGTYTSSIGDSGTITGSYDSDDYDQNSSLAMIQGIWSFTSPFDPSYVNTVTVGGDGSFSGSDTFGCLYDGIISLIDTNYNLYDITITVSNCTIPPYTTPFDDTFKGKMSLDYDGNLLAGVSGTSMVIIANSANQPFVISYTKQ